VSTDLRRGATLIATNLDDIMQQQGRTRTWLSRQLGYSRPHVSRICSGKRRVRLADAHTSSVLLGVPMQYLFAEAPADST
jgi:antitoxin component HigA of HigAB toxin-antitoxin module